MKKKIIGAALMLSCMAACSHPSAEDKTKELESTKGEWTHAQTNKAIDLYIEGLKSEEDLLNRELEVRRGLKFFDENRCSREVLKSRRSEIDSMRSLLAKKRAQIDSISR